MSPHNPLVEGPIEYSVRLTFRVNAHDPEHARTRFISQLNEFGLSTWTYRVTRVDTDEDSLVQDGVVMTPEEFEEQLAVSDMDEYFATGSDLSLDEDEDDEDEEDEEDEEDGDDGDDEDDALLEAAIAAGFHGDVTHLLRDVPAAFAAWDLRVRTFEVSLRWAMNHQQPILAVRYELATDQEAAMRRSIQFHLYFRAADDSLLAAGGFFVSDRTWDRSRGIAIHDDSIDLLNVFDYNRPLASIEISPEPRPGAVEDPSDVYVYALQGLPQRVQAVLQALDVHTVQDLLDRDLAVAPGLEPKDLVRIEQELAFLGFQRG